MHASPDHLRRLAATLDAVRLELDRHRIAASGPLSAPIGSDPEWAATSALHQLTAVLDEGLARVGRGFDDTTEAMRAAAGAYEEADERAVCRLRGCLRAASGRSGDRSGSRRGVRRTEPEWSEEPSAHSGSAASHATRTGTGAVKRTESGADRGGTW